MESVTYFSAFIAFSISLTAANVINSFCQAVRYFCKPVYFLFKADKRMFFIAEHCTENFFQEFFNFRQLIRYVFEIVNIT